MPNFAANLTLMFTEHSLLDRYDAAAQAGFTGVEVLFPYECAAADVANRLTSNGLRQVLLNVPAGDWEKGERGFAAVAGQQEAFRTNVEIALAYAVEIDCPLIHAMAGIVADSDRAAAQNVFVDNLAWAADKAGAAGRTVVIEPINNVRDVPGYFLNTTTQARHILSQVQSPHLGLQFDMYHVQIMEGDVTTRLGQCKDLIRHIQIAGVPERHEPDIGEMNYPYLFDQVDALGLKCWLGCEYHPRGETVAGLGWFDAYKSVR